VGRGARGASGRRSGIDWTVCGSQASPGLALRCPDPQCLEPWAKGGAGSTEARSYPWCLTTVYLGTDLVAVLCCTVLYCAALAVQVRFSGITWSGFEVPNAVFGGLDKRPYWDHMDQMKALGFNLVRPAL